MTITSSNSAPTWNASVVSASYISTMATAVLENGTLPISYSSLSTAAPATDADGQVIKYKVTAVNSGTLTLGGVAYTSASTMPATAYLSTGETMLWTPPTDIETSPQTAFTMKASDGTLDSTQAVTVKVNVTPVNSAPVIVGPYTVTGVTRNTWKEVTFANLITYLGVSDVETASSSLILQVESLVSGQSLQIGNSGGTGGSVTAFSSSNKQLTTGKSIYWLPPANTTGIVDAIKFSVIDAGGVSSATQGLLRMNIDTGSNAAPSIATATVNLNTTVGTTGVGAAFSLSHTQLLAALGATDTDSSYITFVLTSISNGSIKKSSTTMTTTTGASQANPIAPNATSIVSPGETVVFLPTSTTTGSAVTLATVIAYDGTTYSATSGTLQATFTAAANQIPVLGYVRDFTTGTKDTNFVFSYDDLRGDPTLMNLGAQRTDAFDSEEVIANKTLKFRIKAINASSYLCLNT
ncbi:hypothetical protein EBU99_15010, partial [bacterium]|nr:hypothetical protein [bacterium]